MAKETKSIEVNPDSERATIDLWENFGWEVLNSQTVHFKDTHQELRGDDTYSVTETTHYIKITFQRDKAMQNYAELVDLERKYNSFLFPTKPNYPNGLGCFFWMISIGLIIWGLFGIGVLLAGDINFETIIGYSIVGIIPGILGVLILIIGLKKHKNKENDCYEKRIEWESECKKITVERARILEQAEALLQ